MDSREAERFEEGLEPEFLDAEEGSHNTISNKSDSGHVLCSSHGGYGSSSLQEWVQTHTKERMFLHGILDTKGVTRMGHATACMDLPCEWAQFLYVCAERGLEDSALILIATWYREGPAMTQQFNVNHGHPDGDLMTGILAYECFLANKRHVSLR